MEAGISPARLLKQGSEQWEPGQGWGDTAGFGGTCAASGKVGGTGEGQALPLGPGMVQLTEHSCAPEREGPTDPGPGLLGVRQERVLQTVSV